MDKWKIALLLITLTFQLSRNAIHAEETVSRVINDNLEGPNVCKKINKYNVTIVTAETVPYQDIKSEWCAQIPPRCKKTYIKFKTVNRTEVIQKEQPIRECCEGYKENEQKNRCIPHCQKPCGKGVCVQPNVCKCNSGYGGPSCDIHCPPNYYGPECKKKCDCANGASCDPFDGTCQCAKGYQGAKCESTCTPDRYGEDCSEICRCENNGKCDHISGACYCPKGFTGPLCEDKCSSGKSGNECKSICRCQNGGICDEDSQICKCPPGWQGAVCANRCQPGFYGLNCSQVCECFNGATCDHVSGKCICEPGFMGEKCLDQCPFDKFGINCTETCRCSNGATCDQATGKCLCAPGWTGDDCSERICPEDRFGEGCNETCECEVENTESCHPYDGSCECKPGWSSPTCNRPCPFLKYGKGCGFQCDCKNNAQCTPNNGTCICPPGYTGGKCDEKCPPNTYGFGCSQRCECKNGAECSPETGQCFCKAGWKGLKCERPCEVNTYGHGCSEKCDCLNNGACSPITGECYCAPGYIGKQCEKKCEAWTFGQNCSFECNCEAANTLACDHVTGSCLCKTEYNGGQTIKYAGVKCESTCPLGFYGSECHHQCNCKNNSSCDPVSGECFCERGWTGRTCDQKCPTGYYGQNCREKCPDNMPVKTTCDHVTGEFKCRPGYVGLTCDHPCKSGSYGEDCKSECKCHHGECHHVDGVCHCIPGWTGDFCEISCPNGTWGINCQHKCNCENNAQCRKSDGVCVCEKGFMGTRCEEVCPEGYFGDQCLHTCNCNRRPNFVCHPADGCVCKSGFKGKNCDESAYLANTTDPSEDYFTDAFESTTNDENLTFGFDDSYASTIPSALESHTSSGVSSLTIASFDDGENSSPPTPFTTDSSTKFTFAPLEPVTPKTNSLEPSLRKHSDDEITTKFTFAPLHPTSPSYQKDVADLKTTFIHTLDTTTPMNNNDNDKTMIYARENVGDSDIGATKGEEEATQKNYKELSTDAHEKEEEEEEKVMTTMSTAESKPQTNFTSKLDSSDALAYTSTEMTSRNVDYTTVSSEIDATAGTVDGQQNSTANEKLWSSIKSTVEAREIDSDAKTNSDRNNSTNEGRNSKSGHQTTESNENRPVESASGLHSTTTKSYSPYLQVNVPIATHTAVSPQYNAYPNETRFDTEYLNDRNESKEVYAYENGNITTMKTTTTTLQTIFHDLLINKTKGDSDSRDTKIVEQMELKHDGDDVDDESSSVSRSGVIWGVFCTLLFISIIMAVLLYYRRRVANLKAEIGHVVRYMSDDPRNFDNPVYQYQPSVNTDTSTLLHRNAIMNNLRETRPSHMDRLNNFDHDSNSSGRAAAYSLQYDPELMNQKNHDADMTNPNVYSSIDDHLYDEIKLKYADLDSEYDHLDYSRPQQPMSKHYQRATSSTMSQNIHRDRESNQSNGRHFSSSLDNTYDAPIPHPKKLNISVPPLPAKNNINSNLTPSPSSSTASTVTQDDNIDAIISVEKPMHKDLNGKPDVMNDTQTDNTKLEL